jgi:hypothetical protein
MTDSAPFRQVGALRYWRFDADHPHFADVPLLTRHADGTIVALRGELPDLPTGMAERIEHGTVYGYLANPDIEVIEIVAVGAEVVDPREAWLHTFGDEAYAAESLIGYCDGVAALLRTLNRALIAGWDVIATLDEGVAFGPRR